MEVGDTNIYLNGMSHGNWKKNTKKYHVKPKMMFRDIINQKVLHELFVQYCLVR